MSTAPNPVFTRQPTAAPINPQEVLDAVLKQNQAFAKTYPAGSAAAVFADQARMEALKKAGLGNEQLEFWPPQEEGAPNFPRPSGYAGKSVLEVYRPELQTNRQALERAIYGDLLHGMSSDPNFAALRQQFISAYLPNVRRLRDKLAAKEERPGSVDDMYVRGFLAPDERDEFRRNQVYSPRQLAILDKMRKYIATGVMPRGGK